MFTHSVAVNRLRNDMDRLFNAMLRDMPMVAPLRMAGVSGFPAVNVWEDTENVYLESELPGVKQEDLDINLVGNELTISGSRKPHAADGQVVHRRERGTGQFTRTFRLPAVVDSERVTATLVNGVLTLTLPKTAAAKPRKIAVS